MWNSFRVRDYEGMIAETVGITGHDGKPIRAYYSRPLGVERFPGIVLIPHMPGWDEWCRETARRFTAHGYGVVCPNIYEELGDGTSSEMSAQIFKTGGVPDKDVMGDVAASLSFLRSQANASGKAGVIGMCSGGRHTFLAAATLEGIDAAVDCWGGSVIVPPERLNTKQPVAPVDYVDGGGGGRPGGRAEGEGEGLRVPPLRRRGPRHLVLRPAHVPPGAGHGLLEQGPGLL